jgi:protein-histidine pros-kinase
LAVLDVEGATMSAATIRDVSARVTAEQALAMSERRFRVAFEESPVAMALVDRDGHLIAGNAALSDLTGYSLSTLGAMTMSDLVEPADLPALVEQMQPLLLGDVDTARCQVRQVVADGSRLIIDLNLAAIRNDSGDVEYMLGQAIDITERVEAQRILEDLVRSKDELIASISHQLRTPLTALVGFANLMSNETADLSAGERSEMMASIMVEAASLTNLVDDLMVAAKSETGDLAVVHVPVDLGDQASRAIDTFGEADRSRIGIDGPTVVAIGDPARVRQVIRSLLGNAIHYGGERITIRIGSDEGHGYLAVADDGPEIPEPARTTMFEPYQRAHESVGLAPSLGLGLSVSRQLARLMGGDVTHRRQGSENVFELRLPDGGATREQSA